MFWKGLPTQIRIICFITNLENKFDKLIGWIIYYYLQPQFSRLFPGGFLLYVITVFLKDIERLIHKTGKTTRNQGTERRIRG